MAPTTSAPITSVLIGHFGPFCKIHLDLSSRHFGPSRTDTSASSSRHFGHFQKTFRPLIKYTLATKLTHITSAPSYDMNMGTIFQQFLYHKMKMLVSHAQFKLNYYHIPTYFNSVSFILKSLSKKSEIYFSHLIFYAVVHVCYFHRNDNNFVI